MNRQPNDQWAQQVQRLAADFAYPATPPLAERVVQQIQQQPPGRPTRLRPVWAVLLIVALLLASAWGMPAVRAAVAEWLELGAVRIWLVEPPTAVPAPTVPIPMRSATPLPPASPTPLPLTSVLDLAGESTFDAVQDAVSFPIRLPTLPTNLGNPTHVYLQHAEGDMVILVWMQPDQPTQVRMSLQLLGPGAFVWKMQPADAVAVQVHDTPALWTQGPYYIKVGNGAIWGNVRLVTGHVLIWTEGEITYRLESDLALTEATQVAESLR